MQIEKIARTSYAFLVVAVVTVVGAAALPANAEVAKGETACGSLTTAGSGVDYGPYDYRTAPSVALQTVEKYHFTAKVERLITGESGYIIGNDLDFTLRHFPNHARALSALVKLAMREKKDRVEGARYSVDCWFDRAVRMAPDDTQVRYMYGYWLAKKGERKLALEELDQVAEDSSISASLSYNVGLAYCEINEFDKALKAAHKAYASGFNLPGLRNRLVRAGKWRDPPPSPVTVDSPPGEAETTAKSPE